MRIALLLPLGLVLSACMAGNGMQTKLRDTSSAYNRALRWGDIDRAAKYLPAEAQQTFMERYDETAEELVIVDYELTRLDLDREKGVAASRAQIVWHLDRELVVRNTLVDQLWQFHEGNFVLVDERRAGGEPLALFAEVEETPHPYLPGLEPYRDAHEIGKENKGRKKSKRRRRRDAKPDPAPQISAKAH